MGTVNRRLLRAAVAGAAAIALASTGIGAAWADGSTVNPSVTASGTPGISSTVRVITTNTGLVDLHFSVTQPANICRTLDASDPNYCAPGTGTYHGTYTYPNWQADLTITGYAATGLSFASAAGGWACTEAGGALSCHTDYLNNYFKTFDVYFTPGATYGGDVNADLVVSDKTPTDASPTSTSQCKDSGWASFNAMSFTPYAGGYVPAFSSRFRNQGDCVSSVASGGHRNA